MSSSIKPVAKFFLGVDEIHKIYIEECGNKKGIPVVYLHGGPGGSVSPKDRKLFNPKKYRIILFDQRGSGKSKPLRSTINNRTAKLIDDMEKIRNFLKIKKWLLVGGSWGSTLALAYSIANPSKVLGLVLRGVFLGTKEEANWAFNNSAKFFYPEIINEIENKINKKRRNNIFIELGKMLESKNKKKNILAANIWNKYERILSVLCPGKINLKKIVNYPITKKKSLPTSPFLEWHYTKNNFFLKKNHILSGIKKIRRIPTIIIQGRYDLICPPKSAFLVAQNLSNCNLKIIDNSGHALSEEKIKFNLIKAINDIYPKINK
ncbi:MAG: Proline iminopeptidase [Alphaproteobacteria bacterium MarineAlpha6_Bin1]|nr:MAG: Proline iminopeptidase [Alphaproteobacteria bacterium MarineAlpha6_Bin1]